MANIKQKIVPNLWFDTQAEEAVQFYTSVFRNSKILSETRYPAVGQEIHQMEEGSIMTIDFELEGYQLLGLNGGPHFKFNPSISLFITCSDEEEIKDIWEGLLKGGNAMMPLMAYEWSPKYGWLQDRYGLNWQLMLGQKNLNSTQKFVLYYSSPVITMEKQRKQ